VPGSVDCPPPGSVDWPPLPGSVDCPPGPGSVDWFGAPPSSPEDGGAGGGGVDIWPSSGIDWPGSLVSSSSSTLGPAAGSVAVGWRISAGPGAGPTR
jgi:hypothetical protein